MNFIPYQHRLKSKARKNRGDPTMAEKKMWCEVLSRRKVQYLFLRQKPIDRFILDFYCSKLLLAIEIDGDSHAEQKAYDQQRTEILNGLGIKVIRYNNRDVLNNIDGIHEDLVRQIQIRETEMQIESP